MNTSSMLPKDTILRGIYRIEKLLASGGFGNTYMATNIEFGDRVAIKEFFMKGITEREETTGGVSVSNIENYDSFRQQKEKFKKEARRLRVFNNPHIVGVHDLFEENGTAYYVMDYIDGENLSELMKRTGTPLTEQAVRDLLPQLFDALKTVHDEGLWHLDLKPGNIMVDTHGRAHLIDFGASKQMDKQTGGATVKTAIAFTNGYAPREQIEQNYEKFGPWTDIYALGATLYALLTNSRPPIPLVIDDDESPDKHIALPFPDNVSEEMRSLVRLMMNTNRTKRPQSMDVLIQSYSPSTSAKVQGSTSQTSTRTNNTSQNNEETQCSQSYTNEQTRFASTAANDETLVSSDTGYKQPAYSSQNQRNNEENNNESDSDIVFFFVIISCIIIAIAALVHCANQQEETVTTQTETPTIETAPTTNNDGYGKKNVDYYPLGSGIYEGNLKNGEPHGQGTIAYTSGYRFTGNFNNGQAHGHGVLKSPTGTILFDGEYSNGERTQGTQHYEDGQTFTGTFYSFGDPKEGTLKSANGEVLFKGTFYSDKKYDTGYGKEAGTYSDGTNWEFEGHYKNGSWNGKGIEIWPNQKNGYLSRYEGNFKDGERSGYGKGEYKESRDNYGYRYDGNWIQNARSGYGEMYYKGGGVYKGNWVKDRRSGTGIMYYSDHTWKEGVWENNNLITVTGNGTW